MGALGQAGGAGDETRGRFAGALVVGGMRRCRPQQVLGTASALAMHASKEILALVPGGGWPVSSSWSLRRIGCTAALARGVPVRLIHDVDATGCLPAKRDVADLAAAGAQTRVLDGVRQALIVFDRSVALLSTGSPPGTDLLVREPAIVETLSTMFTDMWQRARRPPAADQPLLADHDRIRTVLHLMSRGATDASAARSMGVSIRTYRRTVAALMADLGASSRFEAGVLAADRGWLGRDAGAPVCG